MSTRIYRNTLRLAAPVVLESLFNSAIFLVDALMVASLGAPHLAAAGMAGVTMWRLKSTGGAIQFGTSATIARRWGEGNSGAACDIFSHVLLLGLLIGFFSYLLFPLTGRIFTTMNAEGEVLRLIIPYFQIILISFPFRLASTCMAAAMRAAGDTRTPMLTTLVINLVNVGGNYLLIYGHFGAPELGLNGAAVATATSFFLEFFILLTVGFVGIRPGRVFAGVPIEVPSIADEVHSDKDIYPARCADETTRPIFRFGRNGWKLSIPGVTRSILRISHPSFWEEVAITTGFLTFFAMIASFGEKALAAHTAIVRIESFSFNVGFGISVAAATMVGQSLGRGSVADAKRTFGACITISTVAMGAVAILMASFPAWFIGWFLPEEGGDFLAAAMPLMYLAAVHQPLLGSTMTLANGLRGAGQTTAPFLAQMFGVLAVRIGVGWLLAFPLGMGMEGIYWGMVIDWLCRTTILAVLVVRGGWENTQV